MTGRAVDRLLDLALIWESANGLRPLSAVAESQAGGPDGGVSGLRPRTPTPPDAAEIAAHLDRLSPAARALLEHVVEQGGEATTGSARTTLTPDEATSPAEELLSRKLLVPRGGGTVVAPGEVGLALRGGCTTVEAVDLAPGLVSAERPAALIDRTAAGAAFEFVRRTELLLDHWSAAPPVSLRTGGLSVRDLRAVSTYLQVSTADAALLIETASMAGLLGTRADAEGNPVYVPTDRFDAWSEQTTAERWVLLATTWLASNRLPALVGSKDSAGKTWNALVPELSSLTQVESRSMALSALSELPAGRALASGTGLPSLVALVAWRRPRRPRSRAEQISWALTEGSAIGVIGLDALPSFGRALISGDDAERALAELLPAPVDHVLIQADLTAVAPGPLTSTLARELQLLADVESRGGATVYRFSAGSIRHALDAGWSAAEIHAFLTSISRTPIPQPLSYLVDDTVRTFGTIRAGHAEAFLRADDETALTELLHHPKAASLGLRQIAPTVLISTTPLDVLLPRLRDLGAAPVVEAADGSVAVQRLDQLRARKSAGGEAVENRSAKQETRAAVRVASAVTALRAGERAAASRPTATALSPSGALIALREAIEGSTTITIRYVDNHGTLSDRVVDALNVEGGQLTAFDHRTGDTRVFAIHRIAAVSPLASTSPNR